MKGEWEMVWNKKKRMIESFNEKILARTRMCYLKDLNLSRMSNTRMS